MTEPQALDHDDLVAGLERLLTLIRLLSPGGEISLTSASTLARLADIGPHRLSELAACEGVSQPAMTQLVSRLERDGFAERRGHPDDRRVVMVHITRSGAELVDQRRQRRAAQLRGLLDALPIKDQRALTDALPAIIRLAELGSSVSGIPERPRTR